VNPEFGYFGVAPGTNRKTNPNAMESVRKDTIFTNVARTPDGDIWWEGWDSPPPENLIDWKGEPWKPGSDGKAAHPNSRFTAPMQNNPALSSEVDEPSGVPISAIIFGGRRSTTVPLVLQSKDWKHGVFLGATMGSETTAAAQGLKEGVRRDPMAMLPFTGYDMGSYLGHWLEMESRIPRPPKIFLVNWFRKSQDGKWLWPGYGDNMRVLKWILDRCDGKASAVETPIGLLPRQADLDLTGLQPGEANVEAALRIDMGEWQQELESQKEWFEKLGKTLPPQLEETRQQQLAQVKAARK
jgi:phosphoenolpyruvate carboxykinase (GTP)